MIVIFLKENNRFLQAIPSFPNHKEEDNKYYIERNGIMVVAINDLTKAGYKLYPDQKVNVPKVWNEELDDYVDVVVTLKDLKLRELTSSDLPRDLPAEIDDLKTRMTKIEGLKL